MRGALERAAATTDRVRHGGGSGAGRVASRLAQARAVPRPAGFRSARESSGPGHANPNPIRHGFLLLLTSSSPRPRAYINPLGLCRGCQPTNHHLSKQASKRATTTHPPRRIDYPASRVRSSHPLFPSRIVDRPIAMDKVLAFSILSASPADTRLSWRRGADADQAAASSHQQQQPPPHDKEKEKQRSCSHNGGSSSSKGGGAAAAFLPRFAPEFDGIDCFETIVSH